MRSKASWNAQSMFRALKNSVQRSKYVPRAQKLRVALKVRFTRSKTPCSAQSVFPALKNSPQRSNFNLRAHKQGNLHPFTQSKDLFNSEKVDD
jgi:hypothetical protein